MRRMRLSRRRSRRVYHRGMRVHRRNRHMSMRGGTRN